MLLNIFIVSLNVTNANLRKLLITLKHFTYSPTESACRFAWVSHNRKLDEEQSDLPEFNGGISEKDYFEEFDEDGEPVETSTKTWAGYEEANQDYNGCAYVYTPVLPEEYSLGEEAELPEICVLVGEMQISGSSGRRGV